MSFFPLKLKQLKTVFHLDQKNYNPYEETEKLMRRRLEEVDERYLLFKSLRQVTSLLFPGVLNKIESEQMATDFILTFFTIYGISQSEIYTLEARFQEEREKEIKKLKLTNNLL
jgi:hypothetical protein